MKQSLLLVSLSILISLTGCGGGSSSSVERPPEPPPVTPPPVTPAPAITAIEPSSGPVAGGTSVTITGTDFTNATAVKFGANNAASFTVASATSITAVSPAGAAGEVNITVTTPGGTSAVVPVGKFTYVTPPPPTAAGLWQGHTDGDQAIGGVVRTQAAGGAYWLVYSSASSTAPDFVTAANAAGFIAGTGTETPDSESTSDGSFASANLSEFNFAGNGTAAGSLNAGYQEKAKFGKGLTGAGEGTFTANAAPTTLSNGESDANLPLPGTLVNLSLSATTDVTIDGDPFGGGIVTGSSPLPSGTSMTFSTIGRMPITGLTDTTNGQEFTLTGSFSGGVFTATGGTMRVTSCENHVPPPGFNGCDYLPPSTQVIPLTTVSGSISQTGGTVDVTYTLLADFGVDVASELTFTGPAVTTNPVNPTFTDGGAPWIIETAGTPKLSGTLAFSSYTATITQGASTTLTIPGRKFTITDTLGTLTYDSGTETLRLTGTTITDVSGPITCSGDVAICGAGGQPTTLPSITGQLTADVVIAIGVPAAGQYQATVFIGGQSSPVSQLTFDGTLPLAPSTTVKFTTDYLAAYETAPTAAAVQGSHSGSAGVGTAIQSGASFSIDSQGALTAGVEASGCTYVGTVVPAASGNVYDVELTFTAGNSCTYSGNFTGVAFFDENDKLTITATDENREQGFLFIAQ